MAVGCATLGTLGRIDDGCLGFGCTVAWIYAMDSRLMLELSGDQNGVEGA